MESLLAIMILVLLVVAFAYLYKKRVSVAAWLNEPDLVEDKEQRRMKLAHCIDELQYKLERMDKLDKEE